MDYTIIYKGFTYNVKNVTYDCNATHRRFWKNGVLVLSVPIKSVLIADDYGVVINDNDIVVSTYLKDK